MTDDPRPGRQLELDALTPAEAAVATRLRDFGDMAVRPFDAVGVAALATAGPSNGRARLGGTLRFPFVSSRAAWVFIAVLLVIVIATIVVAGSTRVHPSIVEVPPIPPTAAPSDLAVGPTASASPSATPSVRSAVPSVSPGETDGNSAGLIYLQGTTVIAADLDGGHPRTIASDAHPPSLADSTPDFDALAVSPDGSVVAYDGPGSVELATISGQHVGTIGVGSQSRADRIGVTWAPDSRRLAVYRDSEPGRLAIVRSNGKETGTIPLPDGFVAGRQGPPLLAWSPDGRWIAISGCVELCSGVSSGLTQDDIMLVAADGSGWHWLNDRTVRLDPLPVGGSDAWADWSLDSRLAVSRDCFPQDVWCDEGLYPKLQITGPDGVGGEQVSNEGALGHVSWSPDGQRVAIASWTPGGPWLVIAEPDGSFTSVGGISGVHGPGQIHWAPDGDSIVVSGNRSLWSVPLGGGPAVEIAQDVEEWFAVGPPD